MSVDYQEMRTHQEMYKNWKFMSANSLSFSSAPIGSTSSLRTCNVPLSALNDTSNYYSGSHNLAPPAKYDVEASLGLGKDLSKRRGAGPGYCGTMGTSARPCLLPSASHTLPDRPCVSPRPGPGSYVRNDSSVYGRNSTFDGAFRQNPAKADLDEKITKLRTIETDLMRIKEREVRNEKGLFSCWLVFYKVMVKISRYALLFALRLVSICS